MKPQLGQKKLVKGEKSFFLMPGEKLEKGIQNVFVLGEDEGLILRAIEAFTDPDSVSGNLALCRSTLREHSAGALCGSTLREHSAGALCCLH